MMKSITTSLSTLRKGTEVIGAGNLGHRIGMTTPDELGDLSHAVDHMTEQLQAVTVSKDELQHEVAERRRAEELLLENEGRLERSQEIAHLGGWELDLVDNILTWSDEVYRIFGLQPREFDASYEAFLEAVHPDDREAVNAAYSDSLREGRDTYEIEHRVVRKSSGEIRYVHEKCAHVRDETGRIIRSVGMVHDITERKRAEESLKLAYAELDQIFNTTATGMRVIDRGFTMLRVNETFRVLSGIGKDEGAGKKCYEVFPGDMCGTDNCPVTRILKGEERVECEGEKVRIDGTIIPCIMAATPFRGQGGEVIGIVESFKDLTERKQAEEDIKKLNDDLKHHVVQLEESNKELEAFSYSVSHDLRSPLRGIDGFSQALLEDYADKLDEEGKDYLQRVRAGSQRMAQLIDDLLNLSRVTRSEMKHEQVDLSRIAKDIADGLGKSQPERDVEFVIAEGLTTKGDERLLRAAMENLFSNAWKFTSIHPKGRIEFGVAQRDGKTVCFIKDDGAGFDMTYVEKLFRPFQRLHLPSDFPGTGIGLATVQRIIHRHGGRVWIEGEVEKGATVYFTLG
jgi:PAS domain S-box-containing protein